MNPQTFMTRSGALELLGETLLYSQDFERSLGFSVGLVFSRRSRIGLAEFHEIENDASRITLGQFIDRLNKSGSVCEEIEEKLKNVLKGRNRLAHRIVDDPEFDLDSPDGCRRLVIFLIELQKAMAELTVIFTGINFEFLEHVGFWAQSEFRPLSPEFFEIFDSLGYQLHRIDDVA